MRRRRVYTPQPLTSLIDVLFILLFASLARATASPEPDAKEPPPAPEPAADAGPVEALADAAPPVAPEYAAARELGLARALEQLGSRPALVLRISAAGELVAIETGADETLEVRVPLLERVPDRDVALAYLGDRSPEMRLCAIAARYAPVDNRLVVIAPLSPVADLSVALVEGLRRDVERCDGALAVIVEPIALPGAETETP